MDAPKLPFRETAHERAELVIARTGEWRRFPAAALLRVVREQVLLQRRVEFRLQERKEKVEDVDSVRVADCIMALFSV